MAQYSVPLLLLFIASAVTSFVTTAAVKRIAEEVGAIDHPNERKLHAGATPRMGGLAIIFGFGFPLMLLAANGHAAELVSKNLTYLFAVLASGSLIVGLGVYDDLLGSDAPKKFLVQTAAAIILVSFGFQFSFVSLAGVTVRLGYFGPLVSIIWIVGVINAVNFIDGIDSLATLVAITIAVAFGVIALLRHDVFSIVIMTALAGSLMGFYRWNRPPAKIFMGDTGSLFIGLLLAACSIARPIKSPTALIVGGPMLALALPVLDTLIVMKQRFGAESALGARVTRMFNADRRHFHHVLVEKYGSITKAIVSIWIITLLFAVSAVLTVIDELKIVGYSVGIAGFVAMLFLRYWFRRHAVHTPVERQA
ncbi:MAG: UDP-GlcNAc:undecaprenyl-phosphate/decaprenyl-phosphate GlcNAc-phosphate transferase [Thermoanaerobaculia bacterium]|jgi:UDP-GlcNAc:undecaprenyl-phosphate GlcNAc-1-phosphate transferase|nr:UDP-GlcNAc:undecaprenyl-phosphate/decaprenyl-phosphate GlcNAc-phosphate transferase [Thermoanaerobaculia bacterium]